MFSDAFRPEGVLAAKDQAGDLVRNNSQDLSRQVYDEMKNGRETVENRNKEAHAPQFLDLDPIKLYGLAQSEQVHGATNTSSHDSLFGGLIQNREETTVEDDGSKRTTESRSAFGLGYTRTEEERAVGSYEKTYEERRWWGTSSTWEKREASGAEHREDSISIHGWGRENVTKDKNADGSEHESLDATLMYGAAKAENTRDKNADGTESDNSDLRFYGGLMRLKESHKQNPDGTTEESFQPSFLWGGPPATQCETKEGSQEGNSESGTENPPGDGEEVMMGEEHGQFLVDMIEWAKGGFQ